MVKVIEPVGRAVSATVSVPGSKSITNRALVCAALAEGISTIHNASESDDSLLLANALNQFGILVKKEGKADYPDLLAFYDVDTRVEQILYEMFMDHRMKTFQAAFHMNYDLTTWYGYAKLKEDLTEITELAQEMRDKKAGKK